MDHHPQAARHPITPRRLAAPLVLALSIALAHAEQPPISAHYLTQAIANSGWYQIEECPPSEVAERSTPGCARIPTTLATAVQWLDLIDREVFLETRREGEWSTERDMVYATWVLEPTGQRYLLVLAPHPHRPITMLYVSELTAEGLATASR
jgi:hypothetical protein